MSVIEAPGAIQEALSRGGVGDAWEERRRSSDGKGQLAGRALCLPDPSQAAAGRRSRTGPDLPARIGRVNVARLPVGFALSQRLVAFGARTLARAAHTMVLHAHRSDGRGIPRNVSGAGILRRIPARRHPQPPCRVPHRSIRSPRSPSRTGQRLRSAHRSDCFEIRDYAERDVRVLRPRARDVIYANPSSPGGPNVQFHRSAEGSRAPLGRVRVLS